MKIVVDEITIEYILIKDFNDTIDCAKELAYLLKDLKCDCRGIFLLTTHETGKDLLIDESSSYRL